MENYSFCMFKANPNHAASLEQAIQLMAKLSFLTGLAMVRFIELNLRRYLHHGHLSLPSTSVASADKVHLSGTHVAFMSRGKLKPATSSAQEDIDFKTYESVWK